ncbi:hypothetical protein RhiirA4_461400 [Rhizophagus irregularis]|uniref:Uncharacterized protein n=1 Tax=Rhizophagus irregularis TaxID=588596 RepID=A0A2I1GIS0_9GLOM|nr:hypothetical protein RhiirA4_461400 [Rhizophagus irregularis]
MDVVDLLETEPQVYNHEPVTSREREFWNEFAKAQIVLKLPDDADKTIYMTEPLSKYMKVEGNKVVLVDSVMLNSEDELIFSPDGIVYGIETRDILIKKLYLQMIKKIELDLSKCDVHKVIKDNAGDLDNEYSGKVIHIIPNDDFTDKTYVPASAEGGKFRTQCLTDDNDIWPSIDAIAPHCDGIHYLYQITIAGKHDIKANINPILVNGLIKLENHLEGNLLIHLYFVVPDINHIFDNFHYQNYVTTKGGKYEGWNGTNEWIHDEIEQYVLEIKLNTC